MISRPATRILHVFDRSCNLVAANGQLLSLVAVDVDPGPFSIVVELSGRHGYSFGNLITRDDDIAFSADDEPTFQVGQLKIRCDFAERWDPRIELGLLQDQALMGQLGQMRHLMARLAPVDSMAFAFETGSKTAYQQRIEVAWNELKRGIVSRDIERCSTGARLAAGVGIGLTPAGDDFLLGVLIALWLGMVEPEQVIESIVSAATDKTGRLSAALLAAAASGAFSLAWHDLALAMKNDCEQAIASASSKLIATGHSSGADALSGFIVALELVSRLPIHA